MDEFIQEAGIDMSIIYSKACWTAATFDGKVYGFPTLHRP